MPAITLMAYAKINWLIQVLSRREDGYHMMNMLMHTIDIADTLSIQTIAQPVIRVRCDHPELLSDQSNLVHRAAVSLLHQANLDLAAIGGIEIHIDKRIPISAGLGGGSADAAATLLGLNKLWDLNWPKERLSAIAVRLGADVPFFLYGGCMQATGIGEVLERVPTQKPYYLLLAKPRQGLSTAAVFDTYDKAPRPYRVPRALSHAKGALTGHQTALLATYLENDLYGAAVSCLPQIADIREAMLTHGALGSQISGSGPTVFGLYEERDSAIAACRELQRQFPDAWVSCTQTVGGSD